MLCGHAASEHSTGLIGGWADGYPLCHDGGHSCYMEWTVWGVRPWRPHRVTAAENYERLSGEINRLLKEVGL